MVGGVKILKSVPLPALHLHSESDKLMKALVALSGVNKMYKSLHQNDYNNVLPDKKIFFESKSVVQSKYLTANI